jgi:hypothetical protein
MKLVGDFKVISIWGLFMNISKIVSIVFVFVMHASCSSMDKQLAIIPKEIVAKHVADNADLSTQRNIRQTCTYARDNSNIPSDKQKLETGRRYLKDGICFLIIRPGMGHRNGAAHTQEEAGELWAKSYNAIEKLFALVDIDEQDPLMQKSSKRFILEQSVPGDRFGLKHCYTENLLKPAICRGHESGNDKFAVDLIMANPHGFAGGSDAKPGPHYNPEVVELLDCLSREVIPAGKKQYYIDLCEKQPKNPAFHAAAHGNKMCIIS